MQQYPFPNTKDQNTKYKTYLSPVHQQKKKYSYIELFAQYFIWTLCSSFAILNALFHVKVKYDSNIWQPYWFALCIRRESLIFTHNDVPNLHHSLWNTKEHILMNVSTAFVQNKFPLTYIKFSK